MDASQPSSRWSACAIVLTILIARTSIAFGDGQPSGKIGGQLLDSHDQVIRPGHAVVFLCDAKTGSPLFNDNDKPSRTGLDLLGVYLKFDEFRHAVTDDRGAFEFTDVPPGKYRLVAQAWSGISGMPRALVGSRTDPGVEPSSTVILYGTAESVEVKAGQSAIAMPKQWGDSSLRVDTSPESPHSYLIISRSAPLGEPVLGPLSWGPEFVAGIIGITRTEDPTVTFVGLPEGAEVHVSLFNYDDSPGIGGGSMIVKAGQPATIPVYAGWSNGRHEPSSRLAKLTAHLEQNTVDVPKLIGLGQPALSGEYITRVWTSAKRPIELAGYGTVTTIDLLAANAYRDLQARHRVRIQNAAGK